MTCSLFYFIATFIIFYHACAAGATAGTLVTDCNSLLSTAYRLLDGVVSLYFSHAWLVYLLMSH